MKITTTQLVSSLLIFFCFAMSPALKAQPANPYKVFNNGGCPIVISYQIYKAGGSCAPCNALGSTGTLSIPAGAFANIPIPAGCNAFCDISITLQQVDGVTVSPPITVSGATGTAPVFGSCPTCADCPTYSIGWAAGSTLFN